MRKLHALLISLLFVFILANNVTLFNIKDNERETVIVSRVIDGDTVELADGRTLRFANINSPEKNSPLSKSAISFLKKYENESIEVEITEEDQYHRFVARLFAPNYINKDLVLLGFASKAWVYESETKDFAKAEKDAVEGGKGIWIHSQYWGCFDIEIDAKDEIAYIKNRCNLNFQGFYIKDESRKIYKFLNIQSDKIELHTGDGQNEGNTLYWNSGNVWNNDRDAAYLFDKEDKIAGYYSYGY